MVVEVMGVEQGSGSLCLYLLPPAFYLHPRESCMQVLGFGI